MIRTFLGCCVLGVAGCSDVARDATEDIGTSRAATSVDPWWYGDSSNCKYAAPNAGFWLDGDTMYVERGAVSGTGYGQPGCEHAYVIDYWMPPSHHPAYWGWIHVSPRTDISTEFDCKRTWTNLRVQAWWQYNCPTDCSWRTELVLNESREGTWTGGPHGFCHFDLPSNVWMLPSFQLVRVASQSGIWLMGETEHYSYLVTNPNQDFAPPSESANSPAPLGEPSEFGPSGSASRQ